jgi:DNA-binding NarL/FixJ family response regulator
MSSYAIAASRELTPRMFDVLRSAARGASVKESASELRIAEGTVRAIRAGILARLDVPNMTAAVTEARRRGAPL